MGIGRPEVDFWSHVLVRGEDECWPWLNYKNKDGYGRCRRKGTLYLAHRIAYSLTFGGIELAAPKDLKNSDQFVLHSCDNPSCCNPKHLYLGTQKQNTQDCIAKNRRANIFGEANPAALFTEEEIKEIKLRYTTAPYPGISQATLAENYGVSRMCINRILIGKTYT